MDNLSLRNPRMPFSIGTRPIIGRIYRITGFLIPGAHRFSVNFHIGGSGGDCALHIDHRCDENVIIRNTRRNGNWENEERHGGVMPIIPGITFELKILVESMRFMIAYDDRHFCVFNHRMLLCLIDTCTINGDVSLSLYEEIHRPLFEPPPYPGKHDLVIPGDLGCEPFPEDQYAFENEIWSDDLHSDMHELSYDIAEGLWQGRQIFLRGIPKGGVFCVNLMPHRDAVDIGLHMSCRVDEDVVVLNSRIGMHWQAEIRPANFKFSYGCEFTLMIIAYSHEFHIHLNNTSVAIFPVRHLHPSLLRALQLTGSIQLLELNF